MGLKESAVGRSDEFKVPLELIHVEPGWNARGEETSAILELAESVAKVGVVKPLFVQYKNDKIWVRDGHRRLAAAHHANKRLGASIKTVNCITLQRGANEQDYLFLQVMEDQNKTPLEQGVIYKCLIAYGLTATEIAQRAGKSLSQVVQCVDLQAAPFEVREMVTAGAVSSTLAGKIVREHGADKAPKVLAAAVATARKEGKKHATERHIGVTAKAPRKAVLTRLRELLEPGEGTRIDDQKVGVTVKFNDRAWAEFAQLLGI